MSFLRGHDDDNYVNQIKLEMIVDNAMSIFEYTRDKFLSRINRRKGDTTADWLEMIELYLIYSQYPMGIYADDDLVVVFLDAKEYDTIDFDEMEELLHDPDRIEVPDKNSTVDLQDVCAGLMYCLSMMMSSMNEPMDKIFQELVYHEDIIDRTGLLFEKYFGNYRPAFMIAVTRADEYMLKELGFDE